MSVYAPAPLIPAWGGGLCLWDRQGKEYIDLAGGTAVSALGHAHPASREALNNQANKLWYVGNSYTNGPVLRLAKKLIGATSAEHILFRNSGVETNEAALKLARKYVHDRSGSQKSGTVVFKNAFRGRMLLIVNVGGQPTHSQDFAPLLSDVCHAVHSDLDSVSQLIGDTTCAVIVEPVQGEGGAVPAIKAFLQGLRELCDRHNVLLIFDRIQIGVGRIKELHTYMHYSVTPDLLMTVKTLGDGLLINALLATEHHASATTVDTHNTAYGGNPLAAAVAGKLLEIANIPEVLNGAKQRHDWSAEYISAINERLGLFSEIRGLGLLIGCVSNVGFAGKAKLISQEAVAAGVMVLIASANAICFMPVLNVSEEGVAIGLDRSVLVCEHIRVGGLS